MFFDWLEAEQEMDFEIPLLDGNAYARLLIEEGEVAESSGIAAAPLLYRGSHCDSVKIRVSGSRIRVEGNPSRWGRIENVWGLPTIDGCFAVFNAILAEVYAQFPGRIPRFTKCTRVMIGQGTEGEHDHASYTDGAIVRGLHYTVNQSVGQGNESDYLAGLATLNYRHSVPHLYPDGKTVEWKSKRGNSSLIYPSVYDKAYELELHALPKVSRAFGDNSEEVRYLRDIIGYCRSVGIVRHELKLKSRYLQRSGLQYWGLSDYSVLTTLIDDFVNIDEKLSVTAMDFETISERLLSAGIVDTTRAANTTAMYAIQWMHGHDFDFKKKAVQTHRARLRKIGIDIAMRCNISKFSPVFVTAMREVVRQPATPPSWYKMPIHLRAVA